MHRFHLPPEQCQGAGLVLSERESHHAADVLRVRRDEVVFVLDGEGGEYRCRVGDVHRKQVSLQVVDTRRQPRPLSAVTLVQAVPKGKNMEFIIQKATELGASRIVPILTERVITQLDREDAEQKREKWQGVAIEAIKQCGQLWLPEVLPPTPLKSFLETDPRPELAFVGALQTGTCHPRRHFEAFEKSRHRKPSTCAFWVGPEGDFTPAEMEQILASGVLPVTLGPLVLRSETAALYALSIVSYELTAQ